MKSLAICSSHSTADYAEWSGTPFNIARALRTAGVLGETVDTPMPPWLGFFATWCARAYRLRFGSRYRALKNLDLFPIRLQRALLRGRRTRELLAVKSPHVLHIGTRHLPLTRPMPQFRHYLFDDAPLSFWRRFGRMDGYPARDYHYSDAQLRQIYARITHFFPVSDLMKQMLVEEYGIPSDRITPVGTGLGPIAPFFGAKNYAPPVLLFVSKGDFHLKGGDLAVEAFRIAQRKLPDIKLVMVGKEEYRQYALEPGITAHPYVTFEQLQELFHRSSAFLMPSRYEPWGIVYLEAMACRMPVIGLNRNSLPEITQGGRFGFLAEKETSESVASQVIAACQDPARLETMSLQAQQYCLNKYSWENLAHTMIQTITARYE